MSDEKKTFDLASLDAGPRAEAGKPLELTHPDTGEKLGITITLRGTASDTYKRAFRAQVNRRMNARHQKASVEVMEAEANELLADCTVGWDGLRLDGADYPFSRANAVALYARFDWIKRQVDAFVSDEAQFRRD